MPAAMLFPTPKAYAIYVYTITDENHQGCLKIGMTTIDLRQQQLAANAPALQTAARKRIKEQTQTVGVSNWVLLHVEVAQYADNDEFFTDHEVHQVLLRSGIKKHIFSPQVKAKEWFEVDLETAKQAIAAVKQHQQAISQANLTPQQSYQPIVFRPEQQAAIEKTQARFKRGDHMLWNAKMRFGKTLAALQLVKECNFTRTLILTHRPVVNHGWFEDFAKIFFDRADFAFGSKSAGQSFFYLELMAQNQGLHYVYFASLQDLRGSELVGGSFDKNDEIFSTHWDLLIIDEAHEGTQTSLGQQVIKTLLGRKASKAKRAKDAASSTEPQVLKSTKVLRLSGTPFNLLEGLKEDEIFTWDYVMEQDAKRQWAMLHGDDHNPYAALPQIKIMIYDLGQLRPQFAAYSDGDKLVFNFREFFAVNDTGSFVHEADVKAFLNLLLDGRDVASTSLLPAAQADGRHKEKAEQEQEVEVYPFATPAYRQLFRHSLWVLPGVKAARALSALLQSHPVFCAFNIVNVAGVGDEEEQSQDALAKVEQAIGKQPLQSYSITLTCGRLTTGVSVPAWTAVLMLSGTYSTSAASYMQTIFRVQTPAPHLAKEECYVFDFAPDRCLKVIAATSKFAVQVRKKQSEAPNHEQKQQQDEEQLQRFLRFCPVIAMQGSKLQPLNVSHLMESLKRVYIEQVVQHGFDDDALYNDLLLELKEPDLEQFASLKAIVGKTQRQSKLMDIPINQQGLEGEQETKKKRHDTEQPSPDELQQLQAQRRKERKAAISILRGVSIRMPLMIYGAALNVHNPQITLDNFAQMVDDVSWAEFMPQGVTKEIFLSFKKYYDAQVFAAAASRILEQVRAADELSIEERIGAISDIFSTFRNPDKETVLTPWLVVNKHLADCLGGYSFFTESGESSSLWPRFVDHGPITATVFVPQAKILEINSKTGLYPLYMAYSFYRQAAAQLLAHKRAQAAAANAPAAQAGAKSQGAAKGTAQGTATGQSLRVSSAALTREESQELWAEVLVKNIFVLCKSPMAQRITLRTLVGYDVGRISVHTKYVENLIEVIRTKPQAFIANITSPHYWGLSESAAMKFSAIVGNPPYQIASQDARSTSRDKPVYQLFVQSCKRLPSDYVTLVIPSRWMSGGLGLDAFRKEMLSDKHLMRLFDYPVSADIFPAVDIKGGVCYFLYAHAYEGLCEVVSTRDGVRGEAVLRDLSEFDIFVRQPQFVNSKIQVI